MGGASLLETRVNHRERDKIREWERERERERLREREKGVQDTELVLLTGPLKPANWVTMRQRMESSSRVRQKSQTTRRREASSPRAPNSSSHRADSLHTHTQTESTVTNHIHTYTHTHTLSCILPITHTRAPALLILTTPQFRHPYKQTPLP